MIRINLIAGERRAAKAPGRTLELGHKVTLAGTALLLVTALLIGWRFWALGQTEAELDAAIAAARSEEARLAEILTQVAQFESQSAQLKSRRDLIAELRRGQSAPVHLIDQVSRALPEMTWLVSLKQDGYDVTIEGRSTSLAALSDYVGNLEATRYFQRPIEIVQSAVAPAQRDGVELIEFTIKGRFQMAGLDGAPAPAPARGGNRG